MSRAITATEANQRFSQILREVSEGASFTVLSRGRPVARMIPFEDVERRNSIARLLASVTKLPVRHAGDWSRSNLYE